MPNGLRPTPDGAPPLPPGVAQAAAPSPQPSMGMLAGGAPLGSGQAMPMQVIQRAMDIEKLMQGLAQMLPGFLPIADQLIQGLRAGVAQALQSSSSGGQQGASPAQGGVMTAMGGGPSVMS